MNRNAAIHPAVAVAVEGLPSSAPILCTGQGDYVLLADSLEDALAIASVIYRVDWKGSLVRRRRLPGVLRLSSVAALTRDAPLPYVAAALRSQAPESVVVVFTADEALPERLKRQSDALPSVVAVNAAHNGSYAATLAALPKRARAERLASDVLDAVFADARRIVHRLRGLM